MIIKLRNLVCLQMTYCCAGLLYNVGSLMSLNNTGQPRAPTDPALGVFGMTVYLFFCVLGVLGEIGSLQNADGHCSDSHGVQRCDKARS